MDGLMGGWADGCGWTDGWRKVGGWLVREVAEHTSLLGEHIDPVACGALFHEPLSASVRPIVEQHELLVSCRVDHHALALQPRQATNPPRSNKHTGHESQPKSTDKRNKLAQHGNQIMWIENICDTITQICARENCTTTKRKQRDPRPPTD